MFGRRVWTLDPFPNKEKKILKDLKGHLTFLKHFVLIPFNLRYLEKDNKFFNKFNFQHFDFNSKNFTNACLNKHLSLLLKVLHL